MPGKKKATPGPASATAAVDPSEPGYELESPRERRWLPLYDVPRNSSESASSSAHLSASQHEKGGDHGHRPDSQTQSRAGGSRNAAHDGPRHIDQGLADLGHWIQTLAEIYMNDLDNRSRWDPRWLNVTRDGRFQDFGSASVTVVDYQTDTDDPAPARQSITTTQDLAATLQRAPPTPKSAS